jgi:hypothetical protein
VDQRIQKLDYSPARSYRSYSIIKLAIDSTIEQDNHCVKSMWGENHAHECFATLQIWLLVP